MWNWLMKTRDMPKELGLFYVVFLTVQLLIRWDQFNFLQVTLPTTSNQVPSNFMLVFKRLHLNLLKIVTLLTLKIVLGYHHTKLTAILTIFTSDPKPILPKPTLWFQLSWVYLIIVPLIMVMLKLPLQSFWLSLTMNKFQIHTPIRSNQLMMMKWIISWNSSIQNMIKIFWMSTSRCFKIDWWLPLLQNFIYYLLCCFINMEEWMLKSQISCHTFLCFPQPRPPWNWLIETWYMPK